jgi:hypothetical protein
MDYNNICDYKNMKGVSLMLRIKAGHNNRILYGGESDLKALNCSYSVLYVAGYLT